jgi:hypothetical protein
MMGRWGDREIGRRKEEARVGLTINTVFQLSSLIIFKGG